MNFDKLKTSDEFDELLEKCLKKKRLTISWIQEELKVSLKMATMLYEDASNYQDEVFMHNALYELSFEEEPITIIRIMNKFNVSYTLAKKIYEFYLENI